MYQEQLVQNLEVGELEHGMLRRKQVVHSGWKHEA